MDFWDRNKQKLMGRNSSHCAVGYGWSPCGRYFMTATLAPRMNVDNGVKVRGSRSIRFCFVSIYDNIIGPTRLTLSLPPAPNPERQLFKYNGAGPLHEVKCEDGPSLFDAQFRPAAAGIFPDRPATPPRKGEEAAAVVPPPTMAAKPRAVYRPPGSTGAWVCCCY